MKVQAHEENFLLQEEERRKTVANLITLAFVVMVAFLFFATLKNNNHWTHWIIIAAEAISVLAFWCNYQGKPFWGGVILIGVCEVGLVTVISTTRPFDTINLPLFDLFSMQVIVTVSLLPPRFVFLVAGVNTVYIYLTLLFQPHTRSLGVFLIDQLYNAFIRPAALLWFCSVVLFIWVQSNNQFLAKAFVLQKENELLQQEVQILRQRMGGLSAPVVDAIPKEGEAED